MFWALTNIISLALVPCELACSSLCGAKVGQWEVEEGWLKVTDALELIDPFLHQNARQFFRLAQKIEMLRNVDWIE